jgi:O-antigen/teichoic acid export membrane protein
MDDVPGPAGAGLPAQGQQVEPNTSAKGTRLTPEIPETPGPSAANRARATWVRWILPALRSRVGKNGLYTLVGYYIAPAVGFLIATPLLVDRLGTVDYGLWALSTSFLGTLTVFELGLGIAVTKYVAQFQGEGHREAMSSAATMGFLMYLTIGALATLVVFIMAPVISPLFHKDNVAIDTVTRVIRLSSLGLLPLLLMGCGLAVPAGLQRFKTPMRVALFRTSLTLTAAVVAAYLTGSVPTMIASSVVCLWVVAVVSLAIGHRTLRGVGGRILFSWAAMRMMAKFLGFTSIQSLGAVVFSELDAVVVGATLGLSAVSYYSVSIVVATNLFLIADTIANPLVPAASDWQSRGERQTILSWLKRATLATAFMEALLAAGLLLVSGFAMNAWLGQDFAANALTPLRVLTVAYALISVTIPARHIANGCGRVGVVAATSLIGGLTTVLLIVTLAPVWGVTGAAVANFAYCANFFTFFVMRRSLSESGVRRP